MHESGVLVRGEDLQKYNQVWSVKKAKRGAITRSLTCRMCRSSNLLSPMTKSISSAMMIDYCIVGEEVPTGGVRFGGELQCGLYMIQEIGKDSTRIIIIRDRIEWVPGGLSRLVFFV